MEIAGGFKIQVEEESMIGVYFSGTGNSRYAAELFCKECGSEGNVFSIEDECVGEKIREADEIVFSYPVSIVPFRSLSVTLSMRTRGSGAGRRSL